jgi:hypothetical protein
VSSELARAHIITQERLRALVEQGIGTAWDALPGYDEEHVEEFIQRAVPFVLAGQRQAVSLTEAFLSRAVGRQPLGVEHEALIGAAVRAGAPPEQVYRRPFVTVWTALQRGTLWPDAVNAGRARATASAVTDVQLSMRATLRAVAQA